MLIDWIIDGLIELPLLIGWPDKHTCPKCDNRLRYLERSRGKRVQCVMCDQVWEFEKGRKLRPVDPDE
jgi:rubredoxin